MCSYTIIANRIAPFRRAITRSRSSRKVSMERVPFACFGTPSFRSLLAMLSSLRAKGASRKGEREAVSSAFSDTPTPLYSSKVSLPLSPPPVSLYFSPSRTFSHHSAAISFSTSFSMITVERQTIHDGLMIACAYVCVCVFCTKVIRSQLCVHFGERSLNNRSNFAIVDF